jgi:hypothetical protein
MEVQKAVARLLHDSLQTPGRPSAFVAGIPELHEGEEKQRRPFPVSNTHSYTEPSAFVLVECRLAPPTDRLRPAHTGQSQNICHQGRANT